MKTWWTGSWAGLFGLLALLWTDYGYGTCISFGCDAVLLDADCSEVQPQQGEVLQPIRLAVRCSSSCSAPGVRGGISYDPPNEHSIDRFTLTKAGCEWPEPIGFSLVEGVCEGRSVIGLEASVPAGNYVIRGAERHGRPVEIAVKVAVLPEQADTGDGGSGADRGADVGPLGSDGQTVSLSAGGGGATATSVDDSCPSKQQYNTWFKERRAARQEQIRLKNEEQWRQQQLQRDQRMSAQCPAHWNPATHECEYPRPVRPLRRSMWDGFWNDGAWKDGRGDWGWELSAGTSVGFLTRSNPDGTDEQRWLYGGTVGLSFRAARSFHQGSFVSSFTRVDTPGLVWCAPVGCGIVGLFFMPSSSFAGNEFGVDLRGGLLREDAEAGDRFVGRIGLRPTLRVARDSRARTASLLGAVLPELGLLLGVDRSPQVYLSFAAYPIDGRLGRYLAIAWDGPVLGPVIPVDGSGTFLQVSTGLSVSLLGLNN